MGKHHFHGAVLVALLGGGAAVHPDCPDSSTCDQWCVVCGAAPPTCPAIAASHSRAASAPAQDLRSLVPMLRRRDGVPVPGAGEDRCGLHLYTCTHRAHSAHGVQYSHALVLPAHCAARGTGVSTSSTHHRTGAHSAATDQWRKSCVRRHRAIPSARRMDTARYSDEVRTRRNRSLRKHRRLEKVRRKDVCTMSSARVPR